MIFKHRDLRIFFLAGFLFLFIGLIAQSQVRQFVSVEKVGQSLKLTTNIDVIYFTAYSPTSLEVEVVRKDITNPPSYSIDPLLPKQNPYLVDNKEYAEFSAGMLTVKIQKSPFRISYKIKDKFLFAEERGFFTKDSIIGFRFKLNSTERLMGAGERVLGMNRRGKRLELYNKASYGYESEANLMYYSLPVVISSEKYMIVFDNGAKGFVDMGATEPNVLQFEAVGGRSSYLVVAAADWMELVSNYTFLTGRQPMPARWALGNISSRMGYHSQNEVKNIVDGYKDNYIPLDGIVLDLFWFGKTLQGTMGNLEWYKDSFPSPERMLAYNKQRGVKTILITEPFILKNSLKFNECVKSKLLCTNDKGAPYLFDFYFGNTSLLDIFKPETKDWFWNIYKKNTTLGIGGWWGDLGEPEVHPNDINHINGKGQSVHNLYGHEWAKMIYEGYAKDFPNQRPVILMRSGFVGSQRYGLMPWSGDVSRTWAGLKPQVEISLQMGMQGLAYMSSDLGGFAGTNKDADLYSRWLQYGVFQPIFRTHGQSEVPAEPFLWDPETIEFAKKAIELRYSLMPYNYTLAYENSTMGIPMMRPLFYYDSTDSLMDNKSQYMWGDNFLVIPVTEKNQTNKRVYLPKGSKWIDFYTKARYDGGEVVSISLRRKCIPVFVKAGSFIPMVPVFQTMDDYTSKTIQVHYYADDSVEKSKGYMYEDDGVSKNSIAEKKFEIINFTAVNSGDELSVTVNQGGTLYDGRPAMRNFEIYVYKLGVKPNKVFIGDKKLIVIDIDSNTILGGDEGAYWNTSTNTLLITCPDIRKSVKAIIKRVI